MADLRDKGALPAPYQSPWEALRRDVPAALADLRLRAQELWRRNWEGDLSSPGFWPQDLAPLFWPLVLVLALAVLILGVVQLKAAFAPGIDPEPAGVERILTTPLPEARPLVATPESELSESVRSESVPSEPMPLEPSVAAEPVAAEPVPVEPEIPVFQVTPLMRLLEEVDRDSAVPSGLLLTAQPVPARNGVVLTLDTKRWVSLSPAHRLECAESWWQQLQEEGYEDLTLQDASQQLLARPSRVGNGMIVFDPQTTP